MFAIFHIQAVLMEHSRTVHLRTPTTRYTARIGRGVLSGLGDELSDFGVVVVMDDRVAELHGASILAACQPARSVHHWIVPHGDGQKSLWQAEALYDYLCSIEADRSMAILAAGGGMIGDLAGFVASTWMRGVRFLNCPTTLLAAIDASIGGKTALNHGARKNLIGTFHHPAGVFADSDLWDTLDDRNWRAALAESVKHAVIDGEDFLGWHKENGQAILERDASIVRDLVVRNMEIKAAIVEADERETSGRRAVLNLGHTVGHAIEAAVEYQFLHGECVALGLAVALDLACQASGLPTEQGQGVCDVLESLELPTQIPADVDLERVIVAMRMDKKGDRGQLNFVLPTRIGEVTAGHVISDDSVDAALRARLA